MQWNIQNPVDKMLEKYIELYKEFKQRPNDSLPSNIYNPV